MITLVVRFNEDSGAIEDQHEPVRSVTRSYRKKSPSELRRDAKRASRTRRRQDAKQDKKNRRVKRTLSRKNSFFF